VQYVQVYRQAVVSGRKTFRENVMASAVGTSAGETRSRRSTASSSIRTGAPPATASLVIDEFSGGVVKKRRDRYRPAAARPSSP
jgi:hypothetical protein